MSEGANNIPGLHPDVLKAGREAGISDESMRQLATTLTSKLVYALKARALLPNSDKLEVRVPVPSPAADQSPPSEGNPSSCLPLKRPVVEMAAAEQTDTPISQPRSPKKPLIEKVEAVPVAKVQTPLEQQSKAETTPKAVSTPSKKEALQTLVKCTDETPVRFQLGAKTAKGFAKSWERYEAYSKATTLKQALELGASPGDIVFDCQKGFLTVSGEPTRKTPVSSGTIVNSVDKMVLTWQRSLDADMALR